VPGGTTRSDCNHLTAESNEKAVEPPATFTVPLGWRESGHNFYRQKHSLPFLGNLSSNESALSSWLYGFPKSYNKVI
jgi:hypothetical protein